MNPHPSEKPAHWRRVLLGLGFWLGFTAAAISSVTIEFQLGDLPVATGTVGILVADVNGDGFLPLEHSTTIGTGFATGQTLGAGDDVIVSVLQAKDLSFWSGGAGFAEVLAAIDYDALGLSPGTPLIFYWFPSQTALPAVLQQGEDYWAFRSTATGGSGGTIAFSAPPNRGVYALTNLAAGLGGDLDLGNPGPGQEIRQGIVGSGASAPNLTMASDSGDAGDDNITMVDTPTFSGTGPAGSVVTLTSDLAGNIGSAVVDANGNWTITTIALIDGIHQITATDGGLISSFLQVTIDTSPPAAPANLNLDALSDTGWSDEDNITKDNTPKIDGTTAENATTIILTSSRDGTVGATGSSGSWNLDTATLSEGIHVLTATATDVAGNTSLVSTTLQVTIDTAAPAAPSGLDLDAASDSGSSPTDNLTKDTTPTITGNAESGAAVTVRSDVDLVLGVAGSDGSFSFTPGAPLSEGAHQITAMAEDAAGNQSGQSPGLSVTIDTTGPALTINQASGQGDPVAAGPVLFTAAFNEAVTGFATGDVAVGGSAGASAQAVSETAPLDGSTYEVSVSGIANDGTVTATVNAGVAQDLAGNDNQASTSSDNMIVVVSNLAAPGGVTASDGDFSDKIRVTWSAVNTAEVYDVYRHSANDFGAASVVAPSVEGTSFDDTGAGAEPASWFYWVVAKKTVLGVDRASPPGGPDVGQRAADQHGNTQGTATSVTFGGGGTAQFPGTLEAGDSDYFRITLSVPMVLRAYTTGLLNTFGRLFDGASQLLNDPVGDDDAGSGDNFRTEALLRPGTYFLEVSGKDDNQSGRYEVHLELTRALLINEIDADNAGADDREFIELSDGGAGNTALDGLVLVFFEGTNDLSYHAIDLDTHTTDGNGYFVAGNAGVGVEVDLEFAGDTLANGTGAVGLYEADAADFPNGTAVTTANLLDAVVYTTNGGADDPGLLGLLLPAEPQVNEAGGANAAGHSLQRLPNFSGDPRTTTAFMAIAPTPGEENTLPGAPSIPDLTTASDSGSSQSDNITKVTLPTFTGTARPGALVTISDASGDLGTAPAGEAGNWSFTVGSALTDADYSITATADKHAGGGVSGGLALTIDTQAPPVPTGLDLDPGSDSGVSATDDITNVNTPQINGDESESGVTVILNSDEDDDVGSVVVSSPWSIQASALAQGAHQLTARARDVAGNTSADSVALPILIDLTRPTVTIDQAGTQADPAGSGPFDFTVEFSETVHFFDNGDVSIGGTALADSAAVTDGPASFNVAVSGATREGSVTAAINAGVAIDTAGNANFASTSTDNVVELDLFGSFPPTATPLPFAGNTAATPGSLFPGDRDSFEFTLTKPSEVTTGTAGITGTKGSLFDHKGKLLNDPDADAAAGTNFSSTALLPAGTYRVDVEGKTGTESGVYDFEIVIDRELALQPDLLIGRRPAALLGQNIYNGIGFGQRVRVVSKKLRTARMHGRVENDGDAPDDLTMRARRGNRFFKVRYFDEGGNVTGVIVPGIHRVNYGPGGGEATRIIVKPSRKLKHRKTRKIKKKKFTTFVTAISRLDPGKSDTVKGFVKAK